MQRALLAAAVVAACLVGVGRGASAPDPDTVGDLRVLVIRATWGPTSDNLAVLSDAADFYRRASFGRLRLQLDITPWLRPYPQAVCPDDEETAKSAARVAGYDVDSYARIAEVLPEDVCEFSGVALGPEVLLTDPDVFVHELGHTFGLKHAMSYECTGRSCGHIDEYGDPLSPMGHGTVDFSAYEKLKLGWISSVQRADRSRTYAVADIDAPSTSPQALVVPAAAGDYWIEHRGADPLHLIVRLIRPNTDVSIYIGQRNQRFLEANVFSVTRQFGFRWLDKKRPSMPRVRALDHTWLSWLRSSDAGSGVAGYRVTLDGKLLATTSDLGTALPALGKGGHRVSVVALDRAGNRSRPGTVSLNVS